MQNTVVPIDTARIKDWESFHNLFAEVFGFPEFYGRNMDAWIDCMSSLDIPEERMTQIHVFPEKVLVLQLENIRDFSNKYPEQYTAIVECSAFVNYRRIVKGLEPLLALALNR